MRLFNDDIDEVGYVMNATRMWAYQPEVHDGMFDLMAATAEAYGLDLRARGILILATASNARRRLLLAGLGN